ncbi:porin family protein [Hymenobacter cheonanensis]|uniref:porin family protein n=1 Tax=Hymenobacter sp. CA2-7 TaxID=3063993 RepID=UPI002712FEED|nr:porin family protein [Hymenobacter sp. CA2-7]MDO7887564.1 porin family protein [Hymenobacter sp. CA2-7]
MKKVLLSLGLLAGFAGAANAQSGVVKYGIKGGFSLSSYTGGGSTGTNTGFKPGFTAGVLVNYGLSDMTSLQIEGLYSQKGAYLDQVNYTVASTQYNGYAYRSTLSYIDVPVLFKVNTGEAGKGLFFELGPQASFALGDREFFRPQGGKAGDPSEITVYNSRDRMVPVGIGYVGGIGYQITSGFGLGVRYTGDFSNVYKDGFGVGSAPLQGTNNFHNGVFQFQVHYLFGGKS